MRSLRRAQVDKGLPVHLTGLVTVPSTYKTSFFFMDGTAGISVDRADGGNAMQPGQRVIIDGYSAPGLFAPVVIARRLQVLGKQPLPIPREVNPEVLLGGHQDSQWITLRGLIRTASIQPVWGHPVLVLKADVGHSQFVSVQVRDYSRGGWENLPGSVVRIRGVCGTAFNDRRQFVGLRMFTSSLDDIEVTQPALHDTYDLPSRAPREVLQFEAPTLYSDRVKVTGTVTESLRGQSLYLQDDHSGILVRTPQTTPLSIGSRIEAVGYPAAGDYGPVLEDAVFRVLPGAGTAQPVRIAAGQAITLSQRGFWTAPFDALLVQMDAEVVVHTQDETRDQIFLRDGTAVFRARLPAGGAPLPLLEPGTLVRVTGICGAHINEDLNIHTFGLLLRSPADIVVLRPVAWWRKKEAGWVVALVLAFAVLAGAIAMLWKRQFDLGVLAMRDPLTGINNRRAFLHLAEGAWRRALRGHSPALLVYLDVDHFKAINDTYGHSAGDRALQCVVEAMRQSFRKDDILGRIGGDEFAVLCTCLEGQYHAIEARLRSRLTDLSQNQGLAFGIALSIGVLTCDQSMAEHTIEQLLARADSLMYANKAKRENQSSVKEFSESDVFANQ